MTRRDTLTALASILVLGGCKKSAQQQSASAPGKAPESSGLANPSELQLDYAILVNQNSTPTPVAGNYHFHSGDRFRVQLRPQFAAYLYLLNRADSDQEYSFLFPHERIGQTNPIAANQTVSLPGEEWYTLDNQPGLEHLVLLAATHPLPDYADTSSSLPRDAFETGLAVLERDHRPASSRRFEDGNWVKMFASYKDDTVLVIRLPLDHT